MPLRPIKITSNLVACLFAAVLTPQAHAADEDAGLSASPLNLSVTRPVPDVDEDSELATCSPTTKETAC